MSNTTNTQLRVARGVAIIKGRLARHEYANASKAEFARVAKIVCAVDSDKTELKLLAQALEECLRSR